LQIATIESNIDTLPNRERRYPVILDSTKLAMCREFVARPQQKLVPAGCRGWTGTACGRNVGGDGGNVGASYADRTRRRLTPDFSREADALYRDVQKTRDEHGEALKRTCRGKREDPTLRPSDVRFRRGESAIRCRQHALSTFPRPPTTA